MDNPLVAVQATTALYELAGIGEAIRLAGSLYISSVNGIASGFKWALTKAGYKPFLRSTYEAEVRGLKSVVDEMRATGNSSEEIARAVHAMRREIGIKYKTLTPDALRETIYQRNITKYGDKLGPTIDYLRQRGKSWEDIIESATRPGGKDINFNK